MCICIYVRIIRLKIYYHSSTIWADDINSEDSEIRSTIISIATFYVLRFHAKSASLLLRNPHKLSVYSHTSITSLATPCITSQLRDHPAIKLAIRQLITDNCHIMNTPEL